MYFSPAPNLSWAIPNRLKLNDNRLFRFLAGNGRNFELWKSKKQCYNARMVAETPTPSEFTPERLPLRGEITGWILALVILSTATLLRVNDSGWAGMAIILAVVFILSAASISFGNWMDRRSTIRIERGSILFTNGVRNTELTWKEIQAIRVLPAQWGAKQVQVIGETSRGKQHFEFRTLGTVTFQGQERGHTGFAQGEQILDTILRMANMQPVPSDNPTYSYYARK